MIKVRCIIENQNFIQKNQNKTVLVWFGFLFSINSEDLIVSIKAYWPKNIQLDFLSR
jgi:hypothetical protein